MMLMADLDAAWKIIEARDDTAVVKKARDKAKACGEMAAVVRKMAAMVVVKPVALPTPALAEPAVVSSTTTQVEIAQRALDRVKGGRRGRIY